MNEILNDQSFNLDKKNMFIKYVTNGQNVIKIILKKHKSEKNKFSSLIFYENFKTVTQT